MDGNGILHVDLPSVDMSTASDEEIINQFILVLSEINKYFCETSNYEPVNWRDYFEHFGAGIWNSNWRGCPHFSVFYNNYFDSSDEFQTTETDPIHNTAITGGLWKYEFNIHGKPNLQGLKFTMTEGCSLEFDDVVFPDCE